MPSPGSIRRFAGAAAALFAAAGALGGDGPPAPWVPDLGDGTYRNPILHADYSDPDAIRVGGDFYLTSSSFLAVPGLPILHSRDLVNWTIINHALAVQQPADHFALPRHGEGVWAPAIRHHAGRFWITYPDPDFGIYLTTATDPAGAWSPPLLIEPGKGLIDPCPFWDDDGQLYLIHGWAKSRAGISNLLTLQRLSTDGTRVLDAGTVIIDGNKIPGWNTLEGPKLYKRNGYYYVFAPSGGVVAGYQAVFRAKSIYGPYEHRVVLAQGSTHVNGPHQGAWVDTPSGEDWFLHFQDLGPYGRVVHLEPMSWHDDWPVIGEDPGGTGTGQPVPFYRKPNVGGTYPVAAPQTSDEFDGSALGLQWQWNANPRAAWASLDARPGFLRLACVPAPERRNNGSPSPNSIYDAPNFLLQKFPAPEFTATTKLEFAHSMEGERAGLVVFGYDYAIAGLRRTGTGLRLAYVVNAGANKPGAEEREVAGVDVGEAPVFLRVTVAPGAVCQFAYSLDNRSYMPLGGPFQASVDRWIGAKFGLIASAPPSSEKSGYADFNWFRVSAGADETLEPLWAYGFQTAPAAGDSSPPPLASGKTILTQYPPIRELRSSEDAASQTAPRQIAGSAATFSLQQVRFGGKVCDWFPGDHPPMPSIIERGPAASGSSAYACGFCHLPNGRGRPENAPVSGQPESYFLRQLADFRSGARRSADPRKPNTWMMIAFAKAMTDDEARAAAHYFGLMKWTPWIKVIETDLVPKTEIEGNLYHSIEAARTEPIAGRIIEVAQDEEQERYRNPRSGYVAYVPVGSLSKGEALVRTGGLGFVDGKAVPAKTIACAVCHGPDLLGMGEVPGIAGRSPSYLARQLYDFQQGTRKGAFAPLMQPVVASLGEDDFVTIAAYVASLAPPSGEIR